MKSTIKKTLMELSYERFKQTENEIETRKNHLGKIRKGQMSISDIQSPDNERWNKRVKDAGFNALERINDANDFLDVSFLEVLNERAKSVCRIDVRDRYSNKGYGTGFLIAPNLIMTNNHVLETPEIAFNSTIQFNYQVDPDGHSMNISTFELDPDKFFITASYDPSNPNSFGGLDFTIVAVKAVSIEGDALSNFPYSQLDPSIGKVADGEHCAVIQHPEGDYKKIVLKDIRMIATSGNFLVYESDTLPGSSGSMVLGLGTGKIIGLHHSAFARKDERGRILRKDGLPAQAGDHDADIDWIANEGVRISSIMRAIASIQVSDTLQALKNSIFGLQYKDYYSSEVKVFTPRRERTSNVGNSNGRTLKRVQDFEVILSKVDSVAQDWRKNAHTLIEDIESFEYLFPFSTDPDYRRYCYLKVRSNDNPWEVAARIESLPHIDECTPDLPMITDIGEEPNSGAGTPLEQYQSYGNGKIDWEESEFKFSNRWANAEQFKKKDKNKEFTNYRSWNQKAIDYDKKLIDIENLDKISLIQLDTGYDEHSKVRGQYDYTQDEDYVDHDKDAADEGISGYLRQPGHGGRTASLIIGKPPFNKGENGKIKKDGNSGLLVDTDGKCLLGHFIPYRISNSVVLIGRGRNLFDAACQAIQSGADVILTCMGSYPRPMLYKAAKYAYDRGVIWVCAAGNEVESVVAPALYPGTIAVAATNPDDQIWRKSSYGSSIDIAAPGEDVYVPSRDQDGNEVMVFGSGTSYAAPQVAAAAALWKAKNYEELSIRVTKKWQTVELFRMALRDSARFDKNWDKAKYGPGILDVKKLLANSNIVEHKSQIKNAYLKDKNPPYWDLGVREGVHFLWKTIRRKFTPGHESILDEVELTDRAKKSLAALSKQHAYDPLERGSQVNEKEAKDILSDYFNSYHNPQKN